MNPDLGPAFFTTLVPWVMWAVMALLVVLALGVAAQLAWNPTSGGGGDAATVAVASIFGASAVAIVNVLVLP